MVNAEQAEEWRDHARRGLAGHGASGELTFVMPSR
jgi:hypothetical protein